MAFVTAEDAMEIENKELVSYLADLTSTDPEKLLNTLLYRTVATGGGDVIQKGHGPNEANYARDACAKVGTKTLPPPPPPSIDMAFSKRFTGGLLATPLGGKSGLNIADGELRGKGRLA